MGVIGGLADLKVKFRMCFFWVEIQLFIITIIWFNFNYINFIQEKTLKYVQWGLLLFRGGHSN